MGISSLLRRSGKEIQTNCLCTCLRLFRQNENIPTRRPGEENFAEWSEVYSEKGGNYEMTIFYSCDKNRKLEVSVNGTKTVLKDLNSNNEVKSVTIPVSLKQGYNTVQMGNNFGWAPDIDRFTVSRQ